MFLICYHLVLHLLLREAFSESGNEDVWFCFCLILGLMVLAQHCQNLQGVHLRRCINVTDDAVVQLSKCCRMLRELNIGGCPLVSDVSLFAIGENCSHLNSINFSKTDVS